MGKRVNASKADGASKGAVLTVCGLGIDRPQETTLGTIQALKECEIIFYIHGDGEQMRPFLRSFCADVRICAGDKFDGMNTDQKIEAVAALVCAELKKGKAVAYVTYGHPLMFSDGFNIIKYCRASGYECRVLPAPSAVDAIIAAGGERFFNMFSNSYVVCAADALIQNPGVLKLNFPVIFLCLDVVVSRGQYGDFCGRIEAEYPGPHPIFAVKCRDSYGEAVQLTGQVQHLRSWEKKIVHMMSMVVPPYSRKSS